MFLKVTGVLTLGICLVLLISPQNIAAASESEEVEEEIHRKQGEIERLEQEYRDLMKHLRKRASEGAPLRELEEGERERDRLREEIEELTKHLDALEDHHRGIIKNHELRRYKDERHALSNELQIILEDLERTLIASMEQLKLRIEQGASEDEIEHLEEYIRILRRKIKEVEREIAEKD